VTILEFVVLLIIAGVCGSVAQAIVGVTRGGCLVSIALGLIGALLGMWIARGMGLPEPFVVKVGTEPFPVVWSIVGAVLFVAALSLLAGRRGAP
jgi:uncharacterized membrane protein YeaQ/YmgE (transglycosylase-associated protein family)